VLANCIRRVSHEVAYAGIVKHGNLQEVVVKHMIPRCICAHASGCCTGVGGGLGG
jgi:hypothetical protein